MSFKNYPEIRLKIENLNLFREEDYDPHSVPCFEADLYFQVNADTPRPAKMHFAEGGGSD